MAVTTETTTPTTDSGSPPLASSAADASLAPNQEPVAPAASTDNGAAPASADASATATAPVAAVPFAGASAATSASPGDTGNSVAGDTFSRLLAGLYGAVKQAQCEIQNAAQERIGYFFPPDPATGKNAPVMVSVPMPDGQGNTVVCDIPLFALVPHHDLMIESVSVRMKLSLLGLIDNNGQADVNTQLNIAGADHDSLAEIEIRLKGTDAVEGIARINDALVKRI